MRRLLGVALVLVAVAAWADEKPAPAKKLVLDAPPAEWKTRPADARGYVCDYDLEGGARVNVLRFAVSWDELRAKLGHHWKTKDGAALDVSKLTP